MAAKVGLPPGQRCPPAPWDDPLRFGREGLLGELMLQKSGVTDEGRVECRGGDIKARKAIEKAKANKVSPEKTPEGPKGSLGRRPLCFFLKPRF